MCDGLMKLCGAVIFLFCSFALAGCASNPFSEFYKDDIDGKPVRFHPRFIPSTEKAKLVVTDDMELQSDRLWEEGYGRIGVSDFNGSDIDIAEAIRQAEFLKAEIVVVQVKYTGTKTGVLPLSMPTYSQSTTTFSGGVYGTANTSTYGSSTQMIPYSVDRHDYLATYWQRMKPGILGARVIDLPKEEKRRLERNKGVLVKTLRKQSPAYEANILVGDVLVAINEQEIADRTSCLALVKQWAGQKVAVTLLRRGTQKTVQVQLNQEPS